MWIDKHVELGTLKIGVKKIIEFKVKLPITPGFRILSMRASCGCSKPTLLPSNRGVKVSFTPSPVPRHLMNKGEYTTTKKIKVDTTEGEVTLTFRATIKKG